MRYFISSGGLGDFFIVRLKMEEILKDIPEDEVVDWIHIESNNIKPGIDSVMSLFDNSRIEKFDFVHDENYVSNVKKYSIDPPRKPIPVPVRDRCNFWRCQKELKDPFLKPLLKEEVKKYDIIVQCSAGTNNDRRWKGLKTLLKIISIEIDEKRPSIALVGSDSCYSGTNYKNVDNLVGKTSLDQVFSLIYGCKCFVGISGLLSFYAASTRKKVVYWKISEDIDKAYWHKKWEGNSFKLNHGTPQEINKGIRYAVPCL